MPIISIVGRRQRRMKVFLALLYLVLALGALTMVYPFLMMVALSFTSSLDQHEFRVLPRYWYDDRVLFRKYLEARYDEDINYCNRFLQRDDAQFEDIPAPLHPNRRAVADWQEFSRSLPLDYVNLACAGTVSRLTPEAMWRYRAWLERRFGSLERLNAAYHEAHTSWNERSAWNESALSYPVDQWQYRQTRELPTRKYRDFLAFKRALPRRMLVVVNMDGMWSDWLQSQYGRKVGALAKRHGAPYRSIGDLHLPERLPRQANLAQDWLTFLRRECPFHFIRVDAAASPAYHAYLQRRYGSLAALNQSYGSQYERWEQVPLSPGPPPGETARLDWSDFVASAAPPAFLRVVTPEIRYRQWLTHRYRTVSRLNAAYGTSYRAFAQVSPPRLDDEWLTMLAARREVRLEFVRRNYREVLQFVVTHGRALWNTAVLVVGLLAVTLVVNPLAAYALSRYRLPGTYKILLFLLATMAFPAEVTMIPGFLLLKSAHLLNTFWALILPAMASGYSIFLLKGFFDSLPQELYESALMDGAREHTLFLRITIPLSKPVLAVIALGTFTVAYGSFMWAFLVCQDPKMWTLMVWLYQMQTWAPQPMIMAALTLAAIPTLLVFVFCQNIIMRGIILPVEK